MVTKVGPQTLSLMLRPPPGARFSKVAKPEPDIYGSDVHLQYAEGCSREVYEWLTRWLDTYLAPLVAKEDEAKGRAAAETQLQLIPRQIEQKSVAVMPRIISPQIATSQSDTKKESQ